MPKKKVRKTAVTYGKAQREEPMGDVLARTMLNPAFGAAVTLPRFVSVADRELDIECLSRELKAQCAAVSGGDLGRPEAMLVTQAHTLDMLFNVLTARSAENLGRYMEAAERYMRLALKAQGQCRATVETLALLKNPTPTVIAKQANVTSGPQQVNNTVYARGGNSRSTPTEQSGGDRELLQDARAPAAAFGNDPSLASVGEVHRTEDAGGQGALVAEPLARRAT